MSGLYQYGNKQGIARNYLGTIFDFINYSTLMSKFMQLTRLFQYKAYTCFNSAAEIFGRGRGNGHNMLFHFRQLKFFVAGMLPITLYINHESAETDFSAESHCSMKLQKLE